MFFIIYFETFVGCVIIQGNKQPKLILFRGILLRQGNWKRDIGFSIGEGGVKRWGRGEFMGGCLNVKKDEYFNIFNFVIFIDFTFFILHFSS